MIGQTVVLLSTRRREEQVGVLNVFKPDGTPGENDQFQYFHGKSVVSDDAQQQVHCRGPVCPPGRRSQRGGW